MGVFLDVVRSIRLACRPAHASFNAVWMDRARQSSTRSPLVRLRYRFGTSQRATDAGDRRRWNIAQHRHAPLAFHPTENVERAATGQAYACCIGLLPLLEVDRYIGEAVGVDQMFAALPALHGSATGNVAVAGRRGKDLPLRGTAQFH